MMDSGLDHRNIVLTHSHQIRDPLRAHPRNWYSPRGACFQDPRRHFERGNWMKATGSEKHLEYLDFVLARTSRWPNHLQKPRETQHLRCRNLPDQPRASCVCYYFESQSPAGVRCSPCALYRTQEVCFRPLLFPLVAVAKTASHPPSPRLPSKLPFQQIM